VFKAGIRGHKWYKAPLAATYYASCMTRFRIGRALKGETA
jgi:hypothetical protein